MRLSVPTEENKTSHRLDVPVPKDFEIRTHQPGIDALIESPAANPDLLEHDWGKKAALHRSIPWGWFALIGLLLVGSAESGEPKIDWETLVCYQPMKWDTFALTRPSGTSFDFRVYAEADNFFSHEFTDSNLWNCFRLTALDSNETLFGYAKIDASASTELLSLLHQNQERPVSVILRVNIPEGIHSRRGIVIEKVMSPRWIYLNPPDA